MQQKLQTMLSEWSKSATGEKILSPSTSFSSRFYYMQDQVAIIPYKYTNDFDFNIKKLKTNGQIPQYSSSLNIQTTITIK